MYLPSFTEIVLLLAIVFSWSRWLRPRVPAARWLPFIAGMAVVIGLLVGASAVVNHNSAQVLWARWSALLTCLLCVAVLAAWTALNWGKPTAADEGASP